MALRKGLLFKSLYSEGPKREMKFLIFNTLRAKFRRDLTSGYNKISPYKG